MTMLGRLDHLVYGVPDLEKGVAELAGRMGIEAAAGGRHPGEGTRNALIALGPDSYLEVVGPDPDAPASPRPRWFGIDGLTAPRLTGWAVKGHGLEALVIAASQAGVTLGPARRAGRLRPDGVALSWTVTDPHTVLEDGLVPFFIDWADSPHPSAAAAPGASLAAFRAEHPDPSRLQRLLAALDLDLPVTPGPHPTLIATLETPRGLIELR
jgi:Glyoxalase-like domain